MGQVLLDFIQVSVGRQIPQQGLRLFLGRQIAEWVDSLMECVCSVVVRRSSVLSGDDAGAGDTKASTRGRISEGEKGGSS